MTFGKFHQSEGLAAISRAMRTSKKASTAEEEAPTEATTSGRRNMGVTIIQEDEDTPKKRKEKKEKKENKEKKEKKEKKAKKDKNKDKDEESLQVNQEPAGDVSADAAAGKLKSSEKRMKRRQSDSDSEPSDSAGTPSPTRVPASPASAESGGEGLTVKVNKKKKKKTKDRTSWKEAEADEKMEDISEQNTDNDDVGAEEDPASAKQPQYPLCNLFKQMAELKSTLKEALPKLEDVDAEDREQFLDQSSMAGAKIAKLMVQSLNKAKELNEKARGWAPKGAPSKPYFSSIEEALFTDSSLAGRPDSQAGMMWNAVFQASVDAIASAKLALKKAAPPPEPEQESRDAPVAPKWTNFEDLYRATFVDAFAEDLEKIRTSSDGKPVDVNLILRCIQANSEVYDDVEKELFLEDANSRL